MRCLVTGAAGFIGSALVKRLVKEGYTVKALIHTIKPKNYEKKAEYLNGDITNINSLKSIINDVDVVFHCAAFVRDYGSKRTYFKTNVEGTKNLVEVCQEAKINKFIFISHIVYELKQKIGNYTKTKILAENYLLDKYKKEGFPVVIIRPGNVYGPGATTWVLRPLRSIQKNRIALVDNGKGIFLHTYIDNLLDALVSAIHESKVIGEIIDITDGDNDKTWGEYLNDLARIAGKDDIKRNMSKSTAFLISKIMIFLNKIFRIEPLVTPMAVSIFLNDRGVSLERAEKILGYAPKIDYTEGMKNIQKWLKDENYI